MSYEHCKIVFRSKSLNCPCTLRVCLREYPHLHPARCVWSIELERQDTGTHHVEPVHIDDIVRLTSMMAEDTTPGRHWMLRHM